MLQDSMDTKEKVKSRWTRSFFTTLHLRHDEESYVCDICQKDLANPSNLTLHRNTHVIERRYKCEPCQVSFHSLGHLQKHKRSTAHGTRVEMTQAFGIPTSDNPRPYGCPECDVAFRKHGHLAKHLRSKSHITRMELNGLVPTGTYAAFEKSGTELRDKLVTTNCELSLASLRSIAHSLFQLPPPSPLAPPSSRRQQHQQQQQHQQLDLQQLQQQHQQHPAPQLQQDNSMSPVGANTYGSLIDSMSSSISSPTQLAPVQLQSGNQPLQLQNLHNNNNNHLNLHLNHHHHQPQQQQQQQQVVGGGGPGGSLAVGAPSTMLTAEVQDNTLMGQAGHFHSAPSQHYQPQQMAVPALISSSSCQQQQQLHQGPSLLADITGGGGGQLLHHHHNHQSQSQAVYLGGVGGMVESEATISNVQQQHYSPPLLYPDLITATTNIPSTVNNISHTPYHSQIHHITSHHHPIHNCSQHHHHQLHQIEGPSGRGPHL